MQRPDESLSNYSEMTVGIKITGEVHMKGWKKTTADKMERLKVNLNVKIKFIVAAVVGILMVAPLTRAYKNMQKKQKKIRCQDPRQSRGLALETGK